MIITVQRVEQMNIVIRREEERDYTAVECITREAFNEPKRVERGKIGCPYEHWMVHELRLRDGIKELSYVAEVNGKIAGHIIYSIGTVITTEGEKREVLNFGPLSVQPKMQRKGIGKALMRTTIQKAKDLGYGAILFFGRPEYYPQFGFVEACKFGITDCDGYNYPAFMSMELIDGYLTGIQGKYYESPIYNDSLNREAVHQYDMDFMKRVQDGK